MNNKNSVIVSTPEQLRVLADSADESLSYIGDGDWYPQDTMLQQTASALRAAADQIEAVYEQAAQIAERDAIGVTLADLSQFPVVQATGARIAFNIRADAQKSNTL